MAATIGSDSAQIHFLFCFSVLSSSSGWSQWLSPCIILFICIAVADKTARHGPTPQLCWAPQEQKTTFEFNPHHPIAQKKRASFAALDCISAFPSRDLLQWILQKDRGYFSRQRSYLKYSSLPLTKVLFPSLVKFTMVRLG